MSEELKPCPFCGCKALYEGYHDLDGFTVPVMFCDGCKAMFTVEGSEDWVTDQSDGMEQLRFAWNRRVKPAYAKVKMPKETQERIERMVHDLVDERFAGLGIVRRKDCDHRRRSWNGRRPNFTSDYFCAYRGGDEVKPDDFCSRVERRIHEQVIRTQDGACPT